MEGQEVTLSAMWLKQDRTATSGTEWEECKHIPNDLEENQIRSVSEEARGNKTVVCALRDSCFWEQNQPGSQENFPKGTASPIFHQCAIQANPKELTAEGCRLRQDPSSLATPHKGQTLLFSVWSSAMELQDNQPHGCPLWLVTPFQSQKRSVSPLIWPSHEKC